MGGGPAGSTLAWKLASKGVKTIVLDAVILLADTLNVAGTAGAWIPGAVNAMQFFIRPPATDLATFDSWPFNPAPSVSDRAAIYSLIARSTDILNTGDSSQSPDLTLDDPSVTGFSVSLTQQSVPGMPMGPAIPTQSFNVRRQSTGSPTLLQQYQSLHIPVTIVVGNSPQPLVTPQAATDPYQITVTIPPATVFLLQITPVVDPTLFASNACQPAPRSFYIEVASALSVSSLNDAATALNNALQPNLTSPTSSTDTGTDQLQAALSLAGLASPTSNVNLAPQIHRVELMVQRWRGQGRPLVREDQQGNPTLFGFPYTDLKNAGPNSADTVLAPLDGVYFGERDSNDQLVWWRRRTRSRTRPGAPCFTLTIFPILRRPCTIASQCVYSADTKVSSREARRWSPASLKRLRPRLPVPHRNSGDGFFRFAAGQLLLRNLPSGSSCRSLVPSTASRLRDCWWCSTSPGTIGPGSRNSSRSR